MKNERKRSFIELISSLWFWLIIAIIINICLILIDKFYNKEWLSVVSNILQIFTVVIAIAAWIESKTFISRRIGRTGEAQADLNTTVLIIDINTDDSTPGKKGKGIYNNVMDYLTGTKIIDEDGASLNHTIKGIPDQFELKTDETGRIIYLTGILMPNDKSVLGYTYGFRKALGVVENLIRNNGRTIVHLFCACPVAVSYIVGDRFKNNFEVFVYQYNTNKNEYFQVL